MIIPVTEVTEWCAPIVVNLKKGNRQSAQMNKYVLREKYQLLIPADTIADIYIAAEDINLLCRSRDIYHQCPLDE